MPRAKVLRIICAAIVFWSIISGKIAASELPNPYAIQSISFDAKRYDQKKTLDIVVMAFVDELDSVGLLDFDPEGVTVAIDYEWIFVKDKVRTISLTFYATPEFSGTFTVDVRGIAPKASNPMTTIAQLAAKEFAERWFKYAARGAQPESTQAEGIAD